MAYLFDSSCYLFDYFFLCQIESLFCFGNAVLDHNWFWKECFPQWKLAFTYHVALFCGDF